MKNLIRKILVESAKEKFINTVVSKLKPPYFKNLNKLAADDQEIEIISKMLFGEGVTVVNNLSNGYYSILDDEGNKIYYENSAGYWIKSEYDDRGNIIYHEDSDGRWEKSEYDGRGNKIYYENSSGDYKIINDKGDVIYYENSDGNWDKWGYDKMGNQIYYENSDGTWWKRRYDERGNLIYHETSIRGVTLDKR